MYPLLTTNRVLALIVTVWGLLCLVGWVPRWLESAQPSSRKALRLEGAVAVILGIDFTLFWWFESRWALDLGRFSALAIIAVLFAYHAVVGIRAVTRFRQLSRSESERFKAHFGKRE
jgi:hypothetical protein